MAKHVRCVGAVIVDGADRLLMIQRGTPPGQGLWSIPGGRVEPGESDETALIREVLEETGLAVAPGHLIGSVERPGPERDHTTADVVYDIHDYAASLIDPSAVPVAGDDARDVRWVPFAELRTLPTATGLLEALRAWRVLPS